MIFTDDAKASVMVKVTAISLPIFIGLSFILFSCSSAKDANEDNFKKPSAKL
jgi:preprotein translocase subunit SecG